MAEPMEFWAVYEWLHTRDGNSYVAIDDVCETTYDEMIATAYAALRRNELIEVHHRKPDGTVEIISEDEIWQMYEDDKRQDRIDARYRTGMCPGVTD